MKADLARPTFSGSGLHRSAKDFSGRSPLSSMGENEHTAARIARIRADPSVPAPQFAQTLNEIGEPPATSIGRFYDSEVVIPTGVETLRLARAIEEIEQPTLRQLHGIAAGQRLLSFAVGMRLVQRYI